MSENKTVKAVIIFADGKEEQMEFKKWMDYAAYVEKNHGRISEAHGAIEEGE